MEDALAHLREDMKFSKGLVLILVVMEDALALPNQGTHWLMYLGLNPCCNGRCTRTLRK